MIKKKSLIVLSILAILVASAGISYKVFQKGRDISKNNNQNNDEIIEVPGQNNDEAEPLNSKADGLLFEALNIALENDANMENVFEKIRQSADEGNSDAQYFAGEMLFQGIGVEPDRELAAQYLEKACESGNKKAFLIYGKMKFLGDCVYQDYEESASYFYTIDDEEPYAAYMLGIMYNLGMGVPANGELASYYLSKAVGTGYEPVIDYSDKVINTGIIMTGTEDFNLSAKNIVDIEYSGSYSQLEDMAEQYYQQLKKSESYPEFDEEMKAVCDMDAAAVNYITVFGKDNWLFFQSENDGDTMHDYIGDNHFTSEELENIASNLNRQKELAESKGAKFVLLLLPNKETVYSEKMPTYIKRADTVTREDALVEYLKENTDIDVIYTKDSLAKYKDKCQLYYKTDTHANMAGSLVILSDLLNNCYSYNLEPDFSKFEIHSNDFLGDLGNMAKCSGRYATDMVYFYPESNVGNDDKIDSTMMLVGDSFSEFINLEAGYYFNKGIDHRMITEYNFDYNAATEAGYMSSIPDVVVWECVERYLDRLCTDR